MTNKNEAQLLVEDTIFSLCKMFFLLCFYTMNKTYYTINFVYCDMYLNKIVKLFQS